MNGCEGRGGWGGGVGIGQATRVAVSSSQGPPTGCGVLDPLPPRHTCTHLLDAPIRAGQQRGAAFSGRPLPARTYAAVAVAAALKGTR